MIDRGLVAISGRLWFVNQVANDGASIDIAPEQDEDAIWKLAIEEMRIGDVPTVHFESRTEPPEARFFPEGLAKPELAELVRVQSSDVTMEEVFEVIDGVHEQQLVTPYAQGRAGKLWKDPGQGLAANDAEDEIQLVIRAGLTGRFPTCVIRPEQPLPTGRLDVEIEEPSPQDRTQVIKHAILELKVLRDRRPSSAVSEAETREWVRSGVVQASEYRNDKGARQAALCCFDMRSTPSDQDCFIPVRKLAGQLRVWLKCWHIFASSSAYRDHRASIATGEGKHG
jgi:hypothetical protein